MVAYLFKIFSNKCCTSCWKPIKEFQLVSCKSGHTQIESVLGSGSNMHFLPMSHTGKANNEDSFLLTWKIPIDDDKSGVKCIGDFLKFFTHQENTGINVYNILDQCRFVITSQNAVVSAWERKC